MLRYTSSLMELSRKGERPTTKACGEEDAVWFAAPFAAANKLSSRRRKTLHFITYLCDWERGCVPLRDQPQHFGVRLRCRQSGGSSGHACCGWTQPRSF